MAAKEKLTKWTILNNNGKWVEVRIQRPDGEYKYTWTKDPCLILCFDKPPLDKPVNSKIIEIEISKYYRVVRKDFIPEIIETDYQPFAGENEFETYDDALKNVIATNKEKIKEYKNLAKALTDWNNAHK